MSDLFHSGVVVDLVIACLMLEGLLVWGLARQRQALPVATWVAGLGLLLAWRFAQGGAAWIWIALPLSAAGMAHGWDLWRRWPAR